jgi:hypothetical protein
MEGGISAANFNNGLGKVDIYAPWDWVTRVHNFCAVYGGIMECALTYQLGESGFESHLSREWEFSGGAWFTLQSGAVNQ